MRFEVQVGDQRYEIEAPDRETAIRKLESSPKLKRPPPGPPGVVEDIAKGAGSGLVQGAVELPGAVGDIDNVARMIGGWIGNQLRGLEGREPVDPPDRLTKGILPDSQDMVAATGFKGSTLDYEPKTDLGTVAKSATRAVPGMMALGPGKGLTGAAVNAGLGVGTGAGMELGGQFADRALPENLRPYAQLVGSVLGYMMSKKMITPHPSTAARESAYQNLKDEGVKTVTPGQRTGDPRLLRREAQTGGAKIDAMREKQLEEFTSATLKRVGENANRATPEVLNRAHDRIGAVFNDVSQGQVVRLNNQTRNAIRNAVGNYELLTGTPAKIVRHYADRIATLKGQGNTISGEQYQKLVSDLGKTISKTGSDPALRDALWEIRDAMDDALARSVPGAAERLKVARQQYRNLLAVEQAASTAHAQQTAGLLTPAAVRGATIAKQGRKNFARGKDGFSDLTQSGDEILNMPNTSGTAENLRAQGLPILSPRAGLEAGGMGYLASGDPVVGVVSGLVGGVLPKAMSAAGLSGPGRAYLGNQLLGPTTRFNPAVVPYYGSKALQPSPLEITVNPTVPRPAR